MFTVKYKTYSNKMEYLFTCINKYSKTSIIISIKIFWILKVMSENLVIDIVSPEKNTDLDTTSKDTKDEQDDTVEGIIKALTDHAARLKAEMSTFQQRLKQLDKMVKQDKKKTKSQEPKTTKKKPSGFALPMPISDELCKFIDKPSGSKVARTDVTKLLVKYVKDNSLENKDNHRIICPDEKLQSILSAKQGEEITYFNLQTYINHHFTEKQV